MSHFLYFPLHWWKFSRLNSVLFSFLYLDCLFCSVFFTCELLMISLLNSCYFWQSFVVLLLSMVLVLVLVLVLLMTKLDVTVVTHFIQITKFEWDSTLYPLRFLCWATSLSLFRSRKIYIINENFSNVVQIFSEYNTWQSYGKKPTNISLWHFN